MTGEVARRAPTRALIIAFALGVGGLQIQPQLPEWRTLWLFAPLLASHPFISARWRPVYWLALAALAGFAYAGWRAESRLADTLDAGWAGRDVRLVGRVLGLPEASPRGVRFVFAVERVDTAGARVPERVLLNLYSEPGHARRIPSGGDCLALTARLVPPRGNHNPGMFDPEAWLFERGVRAQGHVTSTGADEARCAVDARAGLDRLRDGLRARLLEHLGDAPYAGIVVALALGDQNAIDAARWRLFRRTGVTHLMSISGLHVTLLGWMVFALVSLGWRRMPGLVTRWPARHVAAWSGLVVSAAYVAMSGFGIPAQRTLFMLLAVTLALCLDRAQSASRVLAMALLLVLLIDPWAVLAIGFWLSFGVVAALLFAGAGRLGQAPVWLAWGRTQWIATLALLPALLFMFQEVSLVSPIANAFAIPLISLVAVPLALAAALLPWLWPAWAAHAVIGVVMAGLAWLDRLPVAVWQVAAPTLGATLLAVIGVAVLLLPRGVPGRWLGAVMFLPLVLPRLERPEHGQLWLQVLDVGQGLAVVARTQGHALVYDAGPLYASGEDAGERIVAARLRAQGVARLDGMVVSHDDTDHSGGALSLLVSHAPAWLLSSLVDPGDGRLSGHGRSVLSQSARPVVCGAGQSWEWDGVRFRVLYPPARYHGNPGFEDNDRSCVVRIETAAGSVLLTGDLARLGEMTLLEERRADLRADVLVVGHHGSASSSSPDFIAAVRPRYALISVGQGNPFGHPDGEVLRRLSAAGARILRTDRDGALEVRFRTVGVDVGTTRPGDRRYWHAAVARPGP
jgi:competence protein ComEC